MTKRFTVDISTLNHERITAVGFAKALELISTGDIGNVILLVPQIQTFQDVALGKIIDNLKNPVFNTSRLKKKHVITVHKSEIELVSSRDLKRIRHADLLFAYCSSSKDLALIDKISGFKNIIYIPWIPEEQEEWIKKWNPEIIPT